MGINPFSMIRALWVNVKRDRIRQGGSTLTQQLVKNQILSPRPTLKRKLREIALALVLERIHDKRTILAWYMNTVWMGRDHASDILGFAAAARVYFGSELKHLTPGEIALLVGMLKGPSAYDPRRFPQKAGARRNQVLDIMVRCGILSRSDSEAEKRKPIRVIKLDGVESRFPAYLDLVKRELREIGSLAPGPGASIRTHMDLLFQVSAMMAVAHRTGEIEREKNLPAGCLQAAMMGADPLTGGIEAGVGGRKPEYPGFNRALDARRPIGSLFKPVIFLTALENGYDRESPLEDNALMVQTDEGDLWQPRNSDGQYHGSVSLSEALTHSYNAASVRLALELGMAVVSQTLDRMGASESLPDYPAALLGSFGMRVDDVLQVYQVLAAMGVRHPLHTITAVLNADGHRLYARTDEQVPTASPISVSRLNRMLQDVVRKGTARSLNHWCPEAWGVGGKTGTTSDLRDSWFAGFTGNRVAVVWVGRDDNQTIGISGADGALPIWGELMGRIPIDPMTLSDS